MVNVINYPAKDEILTIFKCEYCGLPFEKLEHAEYCETECSKIRLINVAVNKSQKKLSDIK